MPLPADLRLTVQEHRRAQVRLAARLGRPFDRWLIETIEDITEDLILEAALGPKKVKTDGQ